MSSTNSSISLVSCFAVDPVLGVHEREHPVFGGEMKATHDPCFPSSPPTRVSSLPITSTTTYSSRWLHWPPSATSSSTMVTGSRPSGARTSVQVESRPPSSPSAAQPSKSSTYNGPRFRVYNTSLDSPRPCTPPEIRRATRRWRARSFFSWSWRCCSTA